MQESTAAKISPSDSYPLGLGFSFLDLYSTAGLHRLNQVFFARMQSEEPELFGAFDAYRRGTSPRATAPEKKPITPPQESELLMRVARRVSTFIGELFGIEKEMKALSSGLTSELPLFEFRREFISRRVYKKGASDRPTAAEFPSLDQRMRVLLQNGFGKDLAGDERGLAQAVLTLLGIERMFANPGEHTQENAAKHADLKSKWEQVRSGLLASADGKSQFGSSLVGDDLASVRALLSLADRWTFARALNPEGKKQLHGWSTHQLPKPLVFDKLVELKTPDKDRPEIFEGDEHHLRRRDGFGLTDPRFTHRQAMGEVEYCVLCHQREKDSCSKGLPSKDPVAEGHSFKKNSLGIPLAGCPLDEKISEAHALKAEGDSLAALCVVMLDNPMVPGTGHRICNDCMKACVFQKQEPVNIPAVETSNLTDVLQLPYGFEIYGLLTRWNPLQINRPTPRPYTGKNVLVVGMGPAGYTLCHYLLNEGFAVAGVDGLKIEPFPDELTGHNGHVLEPIKDFYGEIASKLDERILAGFGGVSEYGITVRWDKSFLSLIHLTLARRDNFRLFGGVRFGGTLSIEDAWEYGFDHIAIATGAGKPTLIGMKNGLLRGIRKASDFLMALQLSGAFKKDSLANLQVRLPAIVIGGGLTGIDTATEIFAYYPVQVEKILERHEKLSASLGEDAIWKDLSQEDTEALRVFLEHGEAIRAERLRAKKMGEEPNFVKLVRSWGGVSLCYRRSLNESPAYRLNHEEVTKALEEGIRFIERVSPVEAIPGQYGAVSAIKFERMVSVDGKLKGSGEYYELPARTVCIAAGTSPNVTYEREYPGTFKLDPKGEYFQGYRPVTSPDGTVSLQEVRPKKDPASEVGFLTSYQKDGKFISFYGDNHPTYAGNVVKAMASAKDGYGEIGKLFENDTLKPERSTDGRSSGRPVVPGLPEGDRQNSLNEFFAKLEDELSAQVVSVNRLTSTIVEVVVKAKAAARHFQPGQFYRLQNYESLAPVVDGTRLSMEGLALTGAWVDKEKGLMSVIVLEMGSSSRLCATLRPGEKIVCMGPTGAPTEIPQGETVVLVGGGLGNAVLFSIGRAMRAAGSKVIYFAGYKRVEDSYKQDEIEAAADQIVWSVDQGELIPARRPQDTSVRGNVVQSMLRFAQGELPIQRVAELSEVQRIIAIGSDRMMRAVKEARHGVLQKYLQPHEALGSINSPMQCMMKEICAQCLQRHVDPLTGKEFFVFSCFNQDQKLDSVDFNHLEARLRGNGVSERISNLLLDDLFKKQPSLKRV